MSLQPSNLKVSFWGTRGSLPIALNTNQVRSKLLAALEMARPGDLRDRSSIESFLNKLDFSIKGHFGGNTSCVEVKVGEEEVIFDMGSGARPLGDALLQKYGPRNPRTYHIFMSHLHWDHIMGFPFFAPAYVPGNKIIFYGCHHLMGQAFAQQHCNPGFPIEFAQLAADISFEYLQPNEVYDIAGCKVSAFKQMHSGDSYAWRLEYDGKALVYSTDGEIDTNNLEFFHKYVNFIKNADLVIYDAMYSFAETITLREDWGHSSNIVGVEACQAAGVKRLCLFHHEPANDDAQLLKMFNETVRFEKITRAEQPLGILTAWDGLQISL